MDVSSRGRRRAPLIAAIAGTVALAATAVTGVVALGTAPATTPTGLSRLTSVLSGATLTRGIATFSRIPTAAQASALRSLGLSVQPMKHVPLAVVHGSVDQMVRAVRLGKAVDVYPDEKVQLFDTASADAMGAASMRAKGLTGKGVTVAVVDSGCDASHPDLGDHVTHNVKLVSAEYVNGRPDSQTTIVIPNETGPYRNTDLGSGHGTHVAGIIAADSTTAADGSRLGVAPDAELVCYAIGEILFTTAVVTAYDHLLDQPGMWGVDVVNNSWGNSYRQYDPRDPVHVITKAVTQNGATVVFAAGNSGGEEAEMSQNPWSMAPWVISVAASTIDHHRADFSSNGLVYDNSIATAIGGGGHTVYTGDRIGVYHPDVTAPGDSISSTCDTAGTIVRCTPGTYGNAVASGTSMASPHVAGAVAVLKQANPALTATQVRLALQASATPVAAADGSALPFWQIGYGHVDLVGSLKLVRGLGWESRLAAAQAAADKRVLASDPFKVARSDFWTYDAPPVTAAGTDSKTYTVNVPAGTTHLRVVLGHPSGAALGANLTSYIATVKDASGKVIGETTESLTAGAGTASAMINLRKVTGGTAFGAFTVEVKGEYAASDPDTLDSDSALGRMVVLQVAQLVRQ